jgi:hypothetical protein
LKSATLQGNITCAEGSARRLIFIARRGDHPPRHVHVYRNGSLIVKWDLENRKPMKGKAPTRVLELIDQLEAEGRL